MSPETKKALLREMALLAAYYGQDIHDHVLAMYVEDLSDLPLESVQSAIREIRRDPKNTRFPLPAKIRERLGADSNLEEDERLIAARIVEAISKFGWPNPNAARAHIGETGWRVVEMQGGWRAICQTTTYDELPFLQSQWRELAAAIKRGQSQTGLVRLASGD